MDVLTDADFDAKTSSGVVVVDYWAEWCVPCKALFPKIDKLANDYSGRATFYKFNTTENPVSAAKFNVMGLPLFIIFKDGKEVGRIGASGGKEPKKIVKKLDSIL